jgi:antirestriction protein ArdC
MEKRIDVHEQITNRIVDAIETGAGEFKLPWHRPAGSITRPVNIQSKKPYRGINVVSLWVEAEIRGYATPVWGTYKQFHEARCQVRKGEKASLVVFYKEIEFEKDAAEITDGDDPTSSAWLARGYWVFNAEQVDGYELPGKPPVAEIKRNEQVESFLDATGIEVRWGGHSAFYRPSEDYIQMPERGLFTGTDTSSATEALYSTLLHESVHATGHKSRLDRGFSGKFTTEQRSFEELIAELGAAFLCADLAVTPRLRDDHVHYIAHWLEIMKGDKKAIFKAAAAANRAVEFLHGLQPKIEEAS